MVNCPSNYLMASIFDQALNNDNGIFLISDRTGKGKTYYAVEYALEQVAKGKRAYIVGPDYVCLENFENRLKEKGVSFLRLRSKEENLLYCLKDETFDKIINSLADSVLKDLTIKCKKATQDYERCINNTSTVKEYTQACKDRMIDLKKDIRKCYRQKKKTSANFDEHTKEILFPLFPEKIDDSVQVVLMTIDKLIHGYLDTLEVETSIMTDKYFSDFTMIIDETDACYGRHLIIKAQQCLLTPDTINFIQTFYDYNNSPKKHRELFDDEDEKKYENKLAVTMDHITKLDQDTHILSNFRIDYDDIFNERIFSQNSNSNIFFSKGFPKLVQEKSGNSYVLKIAKNKKDSLFNIKKFITDINRILRDIFNLIFMQKVLFVKKVRESGNAASLCENDYFKFAVEQVMNISKVNSSLSEEIVAAAFSIQNSIDPRKYKDGDETKYINIDATASEGYRLAHFDSDPFSNHAYLKIANFSNTPENDIAWLAKRGSVVMMSGSHLLKTAYNYDYGYLNKLFDKKFHRNSIDEIKKINGEALASLPIDTEFNFGRLKGNEDEIISLLSKYPFVTQKAIRTIIYSISDYFKRTSADEFKKRCIYKSCTAFIAFALEEHTKTGLILTNRTGKELESLFGNILRTLNSCKGVHTGLSNYGKNIFYVNASDFKSGVKKKIHDSIKDGEKVLVVSSRNTMGQSANINYKKDFNFIYIDSPTYIYDPKPQTEYEKIAKYFNFLKMQDIDSNVDLDDVKRFCTEGPKKGKSSNDHPNNPSDTESVKNKKSAIIIQNLGRLSRTQNKEEHIYVYMDDDIFSYFDPSRNDYEHTEIISALILYLRSNNNNESEEMVIKKNEEVNRNYHAMLGRAVNKSLGINIRKANIEGIEEIREQLYKRGVFLFKEDLDDFERKFYVKYKKSDFYYTRDEDYCENLSHFSSESTTSCRKLKYAATQKELELPNRPVDECWVLVPKGFNILLGETGERKTKKFFKKHIPDYRLSKLDIDEFEICGDFKIIDSRTNNSTFVYVDVKNFQSEFERDVSETINKRLESIRKINPKGKLIYLNCDASNKYKIVETDDYLIISNFMIDGKPDTEAINRIIRFIEKAQAL